MAKRYRTLKAKPGELRAYYGKADEHCGPDICYAWGPGTHRTDPRLLHSTFSCERLTHDFPTLNTKYEPSFIKELEQRGYDITTLRFSIQMKKNAEPRIGDEPVGSETP